jgi:hypothetical protein
MKRYLSFAIIVAMTWVQDKKYKSKQEKIVRKNYGLKPVSDSLFNPRLKPGVSERSLKTMHLLTR